MTGRVEYRSWMSDNLRWDALELREGDIVISTPPKSGTTWTQRLVSLLVFDGPDLPGPMSTVSPWLDWTVRPIEEVVATLDAQDHRRFIKTHTPLDGLVLDDRVTYIVVGRDPRDAATSMMMDRNRQEALRAAMGPQQLRDRNRHEALHAAIGPQRLRDRNRQEALHGVAAQHHEPFPRPGLDFAGEPSPLEVLRSWMERPIQPLGVGMASLATILHHFASVWDRRHLPNVAAFHYSDYQVDLVGELLRLGQALGIGLSRDRAAELAEHATLDAMRTRASELSPDLDLPNLGPGNEPFFRAGGRHDWRDIFTEAEHRRYTHRAAELAPQDLLAWAHAGRSGHDPATAS